MLLGNFDVRIAGTMTVDVADDVVDGDTTPGKLSLREAIAAANYSTKSPATINFSLPSSITIRLVAELGITAPVVINGGGVTLSGNNVNRHFNFQISGAGGESKLNQLRLINGRASSERDSRQ